MNKISQSEAQAILTPPAYQSTEAEDKLAIIRYLYDNILWYNMHGMIEYIKYVERGEVAPEDVLKRAIRASNDLNSYIEAEDNYDNGEWWDSYVGSRDLSHLKNSLSSEHGGDCTSLPWSCSRCMAEELYNIPSSVTWGGKSSGSTLWHIANPQPPKPTILNKVKTLFTKLFSRIK